MHSLWVPTFTSSKPGYELKSFYFHGNWTTAAMALAMWMGMPGASYLWNRKGQLFFAEFLRALGWKIFVGGRFITGDSLISVKPTTGETSPTPPDTALQTNLRALGISRARDSRPNRFYPLNGSLVDFTGDFFADSPGKQVLIPVV